MKNFRLFAALGVVGLLLTLTACSGSTEDVRITLCKDLSALLVSDGELQAENMIVDGYEDLEVQLTYRAGDTDHKLSCFYWYNTHEENVLDLVTPSAAFSTYPSRVVMDGQLLPSAQAAKLINQVRLAQGKAVIDNLQQKIETTLSN